MIQRIQTLFLLGVIVCMALVIIFPLWEKTDPGAGLKISLDAFNWKEFRQDASSPEVWILNTTKQVYYLAGLSALACIIALYSIFNYKNRTLQMKLGALNAFLMMAFIATATYFIYQGENNMQTGLRGIFQVGFFLPLGAMILNSLANRFIKKDEDLVRSVDRIR